jgi:vancomycin resistance protein VanW
MTRQFSNGARYDRAMVAPRRTKDRWASLVRRVKIAGKSARRYVEWAVHDEDFPEARLAGLARDFPFVAWRSDESILKPGPHTEPLYEEGKRHNVRLAAHAFDGLLLEPGRVFSFWRTLGEASEARGFRHGMELAGGCVVPAVGGGLCLLSNALFRMAVELGARIVERHGHSVSAVPLAPGESWGLDATVFHPYVDLRFEVNQRVRLAVSVVADALVIEARTERPPDVRIAVRAEADETRREGPDLFRMNRLVRERYDGERLLSEEVVAHNRKRLMHPEEEGRSCLTCGDTACHQRPRDLPRLVQLNELRRRA